MISSLLLSRLLRYHGDHEICVSEHHQRDEVAELVRLRLLEKTTGDFHRITTLGRRVTGNAIESANSIAKRMP